MKKSLFTLLAVCLLSLTASAQVMLGYGFKAESGTYTTMLDGTAITTGNDVLGAEDDAADVVFFGSGVLKSTGEATGYPIGFDFKFGEETMTTFGVSPSGYIVLHGNGPFTFDPTKSWAVFSATGANLDNVVGLALGNTRLGENSSISYKVEGEAPNRTLTIQLSNILVSLSNFFWQNAGKIDLQYVLSESDYSIKMVFNDCNNFPVDNSVNCRYGIRAGVKQGLAVQASDAWIDAVGVPGSDGVIAFGNGKVVDGLTCTFTYPQPCVAPTEQPTDLTLTATATTISYEFTPTSAAQTYLVVYAGPAGDEPELEGTYYAPGDSFAPQNGVTYAAGDLLGNCTVAYYGVYPEQAYLRKINNLQGSTLYTVYVYAANAYGLNGPVYLTEMPLSNSVSTTPEAPEEIEITETGLTTISGIVTANSANDEVIIIYTTKWVQNIPYASTPDYGTLSGTYTVGDVVEEGHDGKVAYVGPAGEFTVEDIPGNSPVMIAAYSRNSDGVYSDANAEWVGSTLCSMPFEPNMTEWTSYGSLPNGWLIDTNSDANVAPDWDRQTGEFLYLTANQVKGTVDDPQFVTIILPQMEIDQRYVDFTLEWRAKLSTSRFANEVWKMTNDDDFIEMKVSEDGEEWTTVGRIDSSNAPEITDIPAGEDTPAVSALDVFSPMTGDLSSFVGKTVYVAVVLSNTQAGFWGVTADFRNFKLEGAPIPVVPVVTIGTVTHTTAEITWRGEQESYEVQYCTSDALADEIVTVECDQKAILLEDLQPNTTYEIRVRGLAENPDDCSEWSEWLNFTTKDWPAVDAPSNLASAIDIDAKTVTLSWSANEDYQSYNLRYRAGDVFEWTNIENIEQNNYVFSLDELAEETVYLWSVMAVCTHDRTTNWANQEEFETPKKSGLSTVNAVEFGVNVNNGILTVVNPGVKVKIINVVDMQGRRVAAYNVNSDVNVMIPLNVVNGLYIVTLETFDGNTRAYRIAL